MHFVKYQNCRFLKCCKLSTSIFTVKMIRIGNLKNFMNPNLPSLKESTKLLSLDRKKIRPFSLSSICNQSSWEMGLLTYTNELVTNTF